MEENYNDREFMIFNISELNQIDFNTVKETSIDTIRISVDGTKTFVKLDGDIPECIANLTTKEGPYTYDEMLDIITTDKWTIPMPLPYI
jgi:hypothetical protein